MPRAKKNTTKKTAKHIWSEKQEDDLIDLYEEHEYLYNHMLSDFKNKEKKARAIAKFDKDLGVPGRFHYCSHLKQRSYK